MKFFCMQSSLRLLDLKIVTLYGLVYEGKGSRKEKSSADRENMT